MKITIAALAIVVIFLSGCDSNLLNRDFSIESRDAGAVSSSLSRGITAPEGLKISFRSSDIEFWASGGDFTNLMSTLYGSRAGANVSVSIELSDTADNIVFMPEQVEISSYVMPAFDTSRIYDVARMDIGAGNINYRMNGSSINIDDNSSVLSSNGSLNANSIVFINRSVLNNVVYISRTTAGEILGDAMDGAIDSTDYDFGIDTDFIVKFVADNTADWIDGNLTGTDNAFMDVDGALFVPFDPIEFSGLTEAGGVKLSLEWDLDNVFTSVDPGTGIYTLDNSADGTPFNFNVTIDVY